MNLSQHLANQFRQVFFGGNWTSVNLKEIISTIPLSVATTKLSDCNKIADLFFHINYYVSVVSRVLEGNELDGHDKYSYLTPPLSCEEEWQSMIAQAWDKAERFASLVEQLPDHTLWEPFTDAKYGSYYRNITGIIEHTHYHLGQITLLYKLQKANIQ